MNRRTFLNQMLWGPLCLTLDSERVLWVPGTRTVFVPPVPSNCFAGEEERNVITFKELMEMIEILKKVSYQPPPFYIFRDRSVYEALP